LVIDRREEDISSDVFFCVDWVVPVLCLRQSNAGQRFKISHYRGIAEVLGLTCTSLSWTSGL
jgi:hypothetical protein